jgi:hypothetical protein
LEGPRGGRFGKGERRRRGRRGGRGAHPRPAPNPSPQIPAPIPTPPPPPRPARCSRSTASTACSCGGASALRTLQTRWGGVGEFIKSEAIRVVVGSKPNPSQTQTQTTTTTKTTKHPYNQSHTQPNNPTTKQPAFPSQSATATSWSPARGGRCPSTTAPRPWPATRCRRRWPRSCRTRWGRRTRSRWGGVGGGCFWGERGVLVGKGGFAGRRARSKWGARGQLGAAFIFSVF